jgi:hypothetical protein
MTSASVRAASSRARLLDQLLGVEDAGGGAQQQGAGGLDLLLGAGGDGGLGEGDAAGFRHLAHLGEAAAVEAEVGGGGGSGSVRSSDTYRAAIFGPRHLAPRLRRLVLLEQLKLRRPHQPEQLVAGGDVLAPQLGEAARELGNPVRGRSARSKEA